MDRSRLAWRRWVVAGLTVLGVLALCLWLLPAGLDGGVLGDGVLGDGGLGDVRQTVRDAGAWAPVVFVLLQGMVTVAPVPRTIFTVAAGVLFGAVGGIALAIGGTALAAAVAYGLVRLLCGRFAERYADRTAVAWVRSRLDGGGLLAMVSLRLIPAVPFAPLNYALALARAPFGRYVLATVLGVLPGTISVVVLGDAAVGGNPHPVMLAVSLGCGALGLAGAALAARRGPAPEQRIAQPAKP